MILDIESTYENTSPFMGLKFEIDSSFSVINSFIQDVKLLVDQNERSLKEKLELNNYESTDQLEVLNYQSEKIDIFIKQMNLAFTNSSFLLIMSQLESYLKEISDLGEKLLKKKVKKVSNKTRDPFGLKWKLEFENILNADTLEKINPNWELLTCIYNIRSKISHEDSIITYELNERIKQFDFIGLFILNNGTNFSITISSPFLYDIIQKLSLLLMDLINAIYIDSRDK